MPRIDFDYEGLVEWCIETGNGSSTYDICTDCNDLESERLLIELGGFYNNEPDPIGELTHLGIGVDNPALYEGEEVECECCGEELILDENY